MPRVKFSTLISAMAGKSNGSVFSKGRGGAYFRNNKSGYKLNNKQQSRTQLAFSSVPRLWSQLEESERIQWDNAVEQYKNTNIFGDIRTPSGYELFLRLNGNSVTRRGEFLRTPVPPRPFPIITQSEVFTPDLRINQPTKLMFFDKNISDSPSVILSSDYTSFEKTIELPSVFQGTIFNTRNNLINDFNINGLIQYKIVCSQDVFLLINYLGFNSGRFLFSVTYHSGLDISVFEFGYSTAADLDRIAWVLSIKEGFNFDCELFVNGLNAQILNVPNDIEFKRKSVDELQFEVDINKLSSRYLFDGFFASDAGASIELNKYSRYGYIADNLVLFISPELFTDNEFFSVQHRVGLVPMVVNFETLNLLPSDLTIKSNFNFPPFYEIRTTGEEAEGFKLEVLYSRVVSNGVRGSSVNFSILGEFNYSQLGVFPLYDLFLKNNVFFSEGQRVLINWRLFDTVSKDKKKEVKPDNAKNVHKFKPGTELGESTN